MKKQDKILKKVSPLAKVVSKNLNKQITKKINAAEKHHLPDHHFKKVLVKKSKFGLGLFAGENIKKGEIIIEYIGHIITDKEADNIADNRYIFWVKKDFNINGSPRWNIARYCNHSCNPNSESEIKKNRVFVRAIKNINIGEEIVYDYGEEYVKDILIGKDGGCGCDAEKHLYH